MYRVINRNKYIENNLCITLLIYQEGKLYCIIYLKTLESVLKILQATVYVSRT